MDLRNIELAPAEEPSTFVARLDEQSTRPDLIASIAGFDSVAATVLAVRSGDFRSVLPTIVLTGTEYGDVGSVAQSVRVLRSALEGQAHVHEPLWLTSPTLWSALNGRFMGELLDRYPGWSPCVACHLYVQMCRIPLAWALGTTHIVAGDRASHDGRRKLSQIEYVMTAMTEVLGLAGIALHLPLYRSLDTAAIAEVTGLAETNSFGFPDCLLSGNYRRLGDGHQEPVFNAQEYVDEFMRPVASAIVREWQTGEARPYLEIVREILSPDAR